MSPTATAQKDTRTQGVSYGYVVIPRGGLTVDGVRFPEGPRPAAKSGWYRLLLAAGARSITEKEYELVRRGGVLPPAAAAAPVAKPVTKPVPEATDKKEAEDAVAATLRGRRRQKQTRSTV